MSGLTEFRTKHPEYNDMGDQQLADALHTKFYSDVPKDEYYKKVGVTPQAEKAAAPEESMATRFGKGVVNEVKGAAETVANAVTGTVGALAGDVAGLAPAKLAKGVGDFIGEKVTGKKIEKPAGPQDALARKEHEQEALTYQPRTEEGKRDVELLGNTLGKVFGAIQDVGAGALEGVGMSPRNSKFAAGLATDVAGVVAGPEGAVKTAKAAAATSDMVISNSAKALGISKKQIQNSAPGVYRDRVIAIGDKMLKEKQLTDTEHAELVAHANEVGKMSYEDAKKALEKWSKDNSLDLLNKSMADHVMDEVANKYKSTIDLARKNPGAAVALTALSGIFGGGHGLLAEALYPAGAGVVKGLKSKAAIKSLETKASDVPKSELSVKSMQEPTPLGAPETLTEPKSPGNPELAADKFIDLHYDPILGDLDKKTADFLRTKRAAVKARQERLAAAKAAKDAVEKAKKKPKDED